MRKIEIKKEHNFMVRIYVDGLPLRVSYSEELADDIKKLHQITDHELLNVVRVELQCCPEKLTEEEINYILNNLRS